MFVEKITNYIKAAYPCVAVLTAEENRVLDELLVVAQSLEKTFIVWSSSEGLKRISPALTTIQDTEDLLPALKYFQPSEKRTDTLIVFRDLYQWPFDRDPSMARALRDLLQSASSEGCCVIILGPEFKPWLAIEKLITILEYSLPDKEATRKIAAGVVESAGDDSLKVTDEVVKALSGLSTDEISNALSLSLIEKRKFDPEVIYREKVLAIKRSGLLEIIDPDPRGLDAIGGLENLKSWILRRKKAYTPEAETYGLPAPKGVLLIGVPGSGKSLSAKAIGTALGIPTLKLDVGSLFNSLVGESESRTRSALALAEAMAPCLLFVDEIDKGLSGAQGSGSNDSGVTRRVFGTLLSWMQDKKAPVFLVATANQVDFLPPEFLRRGRFDEIFSVDLPNATEREQIISVLLQKNKRDPKKFDLKKIATVTPEYTGAEIEAVIQESLFLAFEQNREIETKDIVSTAANIIPISKTMSEKIEAIRKWSDGRARPASITENASPLKPQTRKLNLKGDA